MNRRNRGKSQPQRGKKSFKGNVKSSKFTPKRKSKLRLNKADAKETPSTENLGRLQATAAATTITTTSTAVATTKSIASKETVNQHVMTARLLEKDVGITEYISKHEGFSGIIKQRFSDFHVNEIDIDGNVVILTSTSVPELPVDVDEAKKAEDYLKDAVPKESLEKLKQLLESQGDDNVEIEVSDMSKEDRRKMHMAILKFGLRRLNSNTKERDGKKYIIVSAKPDRRVSWPSERGGEYVQFVLHKENMDTMETVNDIAGKLRMKPNLIGYAGTKDRRAKTSQLMSIRRVEPSKLAKCTRNLRGVTLGNYTFKESGLKLGQLCGNRFRIVLRNVTGKDIQIKEAMTSLEEKGFINYFGLQRFGNSLVIPTYEIGKAILQTKWKEAVELILKPRDDQMRDLSEARKVWWETRDAVRALKLLRNPNKHIEGKLLEALSNLGANNYCDALNKLPNNALSLYMHAYQSLLWNKVVSRRISEFGLHALAGDLVPKEGSVKAGGDDPAVEEDALNVTGSSEEISFSKKDDVRVIGEKELANIKIEDIVVPLPGYDITYPNNVTGEWMQELLKKDGLESMSFRKTLKHFKVGGTYRRLVIRPTNVNWKVMRYSDPQAALLLSDLEMMQNVPAPRDDPDGAYKALVLEFHLPSSCYATMALREILKTDTSVSLQASLNDYHIPKQASKSKENGAEGLGESVTDTLENGSVSQEGPSKMKTRRNSSQKSESPSVKGKGKVISEGEKTRQDESRATAEEYTSPKKIKSSESTTNKAETLVKTKGKRTAEHFDAAVVKPKETLKKPKTVESSSQKLEETLSVKTRAKRSSDHLDHSASETEDAKEEKMEVDDVSSKKVRSENDSAPVKTRGRTTPKHVDTTADSEEASSGPEEQLGGKKTRLKSKLRDTSEGETVEHEDISKTRSRAKTKLRENIEDVRTEAEDNTPIRTRSKGREVPDGNKIPEETKIEHEDSVPGNPTVRTRSKFREASVEETKFEGEEGNPCNASLRTRSKAREIPEGGKVNEEMKLESEDTTRENPSVRTRSKVREVSDGNKTAEDVKIESDEGTTENLPVRTRSKVREASEGTKSNDEPKLDSEENAPVRTRSKALSKSRDSTSESEGTKDDDLLKNKSERSVTPSRAELNEDKPSVRTRSRAISKLVDSPALESEGGTEDEDTSSVASSPSKAKLPVRTRSKAKYRDSSLSDNDSAKVEPANNAEEGSSSVRTRSRVQSKLRDSPALDTDGSRDSIEGPDTNIGPVRTRSRISSRSRDSPAPEKLAEDSKQDISESMEERPCVKTRTRSSSKASEAISPHSGDNGDEKLQAKRDDQKTERNLAVNENIKKERPDLERDNKRIKLDESVKKSGKVLQSEKNKEKEINENIEDQRKKLSSENNLASDKILGSKGMGEGNGSNEPSSLELLKDISANSEDIGVKVTNIEKVLCENKEMKKDASLSCEENTSKGAMEGLLSSEVDSSLGETRKKLEDNLICDKLKIEVISSAENHETESPAQNIKQNLASDTNLLSDASDNSSALDRSGLANKTEIKEVKNESEVEILANKSEEKLTNAETIVPKEVSQVGVTHELHGSLSEKVDGSSSNTDCKHDNQMSDVCNSYSDLELQKSETCTGNNTENVCSKMNSEVTSATNDISASLTESVSKNRDSYILDNKDLEDTTKGSCLKETESEGHLNIAPASVLDTTTEVTGETSHPPKMPDGQKELESRNIHEKEIPSVGDDAPEQKETVNSDVNICCETVGEHSDLKKPFEKTEHITRKEQSDGNENEEVGENKFNIGGGIEESTIDQSISESCHMQSSHGQKTDDSAVKQSIADEAAVSSPKTDSLASQNDREVARDTSSGSLLLESKDISRPIDENSVSENKDTTLGFSGSDLVVKNDEVPSGIINTECDITLPGNIECSVEEDDSKQKKDGGASVLKHEPLNNKNLKHLTEGEEKTDLLNEADVIGPCETDSVHKTETQEEPLEMSIAKTKTDLTMETEISSAENVRSSASFSELVKPQDVDIGDATEFVNNTSKIVVYEQETRVKDESSTSTETVGSSKAECELIHPKETVDSTISENRDGCIVDGDKLLHKPISSTAVGQGENAKGTILISSSKPVQLPNGSKSDEIVKDKVASIHQDDTVTKITKVVDRNSDSTFSPRDLPVTETDAVMEDYVHVRSECSLTSEGNQPAEFEESLKMKEGLGEDGSLNTSTNSNHPLKLSLDTETDSNKSEIKSTQMETNRLKILPVKESCDVRTPGKDTNSSLEPSQSVRQDDCPSVLDVNTQEEKAMEIHAIDAVKDKMEDGNSVEERYKGNVVDETRSDAELECLQTACHSEVQNESVEIKCTDAIVRSDETVHVVNNGKVFSKDISDREQDIEERASIADEAGKVMDVCKEKCPTLKYHDAVAISNVNVSESVQELKKIEDTSCSNGKSLAPAVKAVACNNEEIMAELDVKPKIKVAEERQICMKVDGDNVSSTKEIIQENISVTDITEESAKIDLSKLRKVTSFTATESLIEPISPAEPTVPEPEPIKSSNSDTEFPSLQHKEAIGPEKLQDVTNSKTLCESMSPQQQMEVDSSVVELSKTESKGVHSVDLAIEEEKQDLKNVIGFNTGEPPEIVEKLLSVETDVEKDFSDNFEHVKNSTFIKSPDATVTGKAINKPTDTKADQPGDETVPVASDTVDNRQINSVSKELSSTSKELRGMGQDTSLPLAAEISMPLKSAELADKDKNSASPVEKKILHESEKSSGNTDRKETLTKKSEHSIEIKDEELVSVDLDENVAEPQERLEATGDVKEEEISCFVTETQKEISCISEVAHSSEDLNSKGDTKESDLSSKDDHLTEQKAVLKLPEVLHPGSETETNTTEPSEEFEIKVNESRMSLECSKVVEGMDKTTSEKLIQGTEMEPLKPLESEKESKLVSQHSEITSAVKEVAFEDKSLGKPTTTETTVQSLDLPVGRTLAPSVKLSSSSINDNDILKENMKEIEFTALSENVGKMEETSSDDSHNRTDVTTPKMQIDFSNEMEVDISSELREDALKDVSSAELHDEALKSSRSSDATKITEILNSGEISQANYKMKSPTEESEEMQEIGEVTNESRMSLECSKVVEGMDKTTSEKLMQGTEMNEAGKLPSELTVVSTSDSDEGVSASMPKVAAKENETVALPHSPVVADNVHVALPSETVPEVTETLQECCKGQLNISEISDETSTTETTSSSDLLGNKLEEDSTSTGPKPVREGVLERKVKISSLEIPSVKEIIPPELNEVPVVIDNAVHTEAVVMSKTNEETLVRQPTSSEKIEKSVTLNSQKSSIKDSEDDLHLGKFQKLEKIDLSEALQGVKENTNSNSCSEQCHTENLKPENGEVSKTIEPMTTVESLGESSESVGEGVEQVKEVAFSEYVTAVRESSLPSEQHEIVMETALSEHTDVNQEDVSSEQHKDTLMECVEHETTEVEKAIPSKQCEVEKIVLSEHSEDSLVSETKLPEESKFTKKKEAVLSEQSGIRTDEDISSERHEATQTKDIKISEKNNICHMEEVRLSEQSRIIHMDNLSFEHPENTQTEVTKPSGETEEGVPSVQPIVSCTEENVCTPQTEATKSVDQPEVARVKGAICSEQIEFAETKETVFSEQSSGTQEKVAMTSGQHDISLTLKTKLSEHIEAIQVEKSPEQNDIALSEDPSKQNEISQVEGTESSGKAILVQMEEILPPDQYEDSEIDKDMSCMERAMPSKQCKVSPMEGVKSPEQREVSSQEKIVSHERSVITTVENVLVDGTLLSEKEVNKLGNTKLAESISCEQNKPPLSDKIEPSEQHKACLMEGAEPSEKCNINPLKKILPSEQYEASHVREIVSSKQYEVNQVDKAALTGQIEIEDNRLKGVALSDPHEVVQREESLCTENCKVTHMEEGVTSEKHKVAVQKKMIIPESCGDTKMPEVMSSEQSSDTHSEGNHSSEITQIKFLPTGKLDQQETPEIDEGTSIEQKEKRTSECLEIPLVDVISEQHTGEILPLCKQGDTSSKRNASCELSVRQEECISSKRRKLSQTEAVEAGVPSQEGEIFQMEHEPSEQHNGDRQKLVSPSENQVIPKNTSELSEVTKKEETSFYNKPEVMCPDEVSRGVKVGDTMTSQSHNKLEEISSTGKPIQIEMSVSSESSEMAEMEKNLSSDMCKVTSSEDIPMKHEVCEVGASLSPEVAKSKFPNHRVQRKENQVEEASCVEQLESSQREMSPEQPDVTLAVKDNEPEVMHVTEGISSVEQSETFPEMEEIKSQKSTRESSEQSAPSQIGGKPSESTTVNQYLEKSISSEKNEDSQVLKETDSTEQTALLVRQTTSAMHEVLNRIDAILRCNENETSETIQDTSSSEPTDVCNAIEASLSSEQPVVLERIEESSSEQHSVSELMKKSSVEQPEVSERMEDSSVEQPEVSERMEDSSVEQPEVSERMEDSSVEQPEVLERMEDSSVEHSEVSERMEDSSVEQPEVSGGMEESSLEQAEVVQRTEESSLEQHKDLHRMEESSSEQPEVLQKMESSCSDQAKSLQKVEELVSEQAVVLQGKVELESSEQPEVQKQEESTSFEQSVILHRKEESASSEKPKVVKREEESTSSEQSEVWPLGEVSASSSRSEVLQEEESMASKQLEVLPAVVEESSSSKQPEILQRIEESFSSEQPEDLQRAEFSISSNQHEVLQRVEESASSDPPDATQEMKESSSPEQPEVSERLKVLSCSNQTEVVQRREESSCSDQTEVLHRMEESSCSDQTEVLHRMEESSYSDQTEVLQRMEESSCSDQTEVLQRMEGSSCSDHTEVLQRMEESSCCDQPKVLQRMEESSHSDQPEVLQRMEESSHSDQPEVLQRMEESSHSDQPELLQRMEESSHSDQPEVLQKEKSSSGQPEVLQRLEEPSSSGQPEVVQRLEKLSPLKQPEILGRVEESSSLDRPEVLQRTEESSSSDQLKVLQKVEETSLDQPKVLQKMEETSSLDQPEVLQKVEETSSLDQPKVLQKVEEMLSLGQPEVLQKVEDSPSYQPEVLQKMEDSSDQPEVLQKVEESSSLDQSKFLPKVEESSSLDHAKVLQRVEEESPLDQPEVLQMVEESSSLDQAKVLQRVEEESSLDQPEVLQMVEESSSSDQTKILQRMDEPEVLGKVEESSSSDQPEVLQNMEESPSLEGGKILQRMEESSAPDQREIMQGIEELSPSEQPEVLHGVEESSSSEQLEILQTMEESSSSDHPEVLKRPEESLSSVQPEVLQRIKESSSQGHFEVSQRMEESSTSVQPEVLGRTEELSSLEQPVILGRTEALSSLEQLEVLRKVKDLPSLEQPEVLGKMEDSLTSGHSKVVQKMEESLSSKQPKILHRKEQTPLSEQPEIFQRMEESSSTEQPEILQRKKERPSTEQPQVLQKMEESSSEQPELSHKIDESSASVQPEASVKPSEQDETSATESSEKPEAFVEGSSEQLQILQTVESSSELPDVSEKTEKFSSSAESEVLQRDGTSVSSNLDEMFRPLPTLEHPKISGTEQLQLSDKSDLVEPESALKQSKVVLGIKDEQKCGTRETFSTSLAVLSEGSKENEDVEKPGCSSSAKDSDPILECNISSLPTIPSEQSEGTVGISEHPKTGDEIEKTIALPEKDEVHVTEVELKVSKEDTCVHRAPSERNETINSDISNINNEDIQSNEMSQKCETSKVNENVESCELSETVEKVECVASCESSEANKETVLSKSSCTSKSADAEQSEVINLIEKVILPENLQGVKKMTERGLLEPKVSEVELKSLFRKQQCDVKAATQSGQLENLDGKAEGSLSEQLSTTAVFEKPSQTSDQMALSERLGDISSVLELEESGKLEASEHNEPQVLDGIEVCKVDKIPLSDDKREDEVLCKSLEIYVGEEKNRTSNMEENLDCSLPEKVKDTVSSPKSNSDFKPINESCTAGQSSILSPKSVEDNDNVSGTSQQENFALSNSHANGAQDVCHNLEGAEQSPTDKTQQCSLEELSNEIFCKQEENLKCNESDTHSTGTVLDASRPSSERPVAESKELVTIKTDPLTSSLSGDVGAKEFDSIAGNSNDTKLELAVKRKVDEDDDSSQDNCQITTKKVRLPTEDDEQQSKEVLVKRKAVDIDNTSSEESKRVRLGESTVNGGDNEEGSEECVLKRKSLEVNCDVIEAKKAKLEASDAPE